VRAREAKTQEGYRVDYRDVKEEPRYLDEMLRLSKGVRKVPVLVEGGQVSIGFGGT
jgi:glutaredoxin